MYVCCAKACIEIERLSISGLLNWGGDYAAKEPLWAPEWGDAPPPGLYYAAMQWLQVVGGHADKTGPGGASARWSHPKPPWGGVGLGVGVEADLAAAAAALHEPAGGLGVKHGAPVLHLGAIAVVQP